MPRSVKEILDQAEELANAFEEFEPTESDPQGAAELAALHQAALKRAEAERTIVDAVRAARSAGRSWRDVGRVLGTSGEAARQRYGDAATGRRSA